MPTVNLNSIEPVSSCQGRCANDDIMKQFRDKVNGMTTFELALKIREYVSCCNSTKLNIALQRYMNLWDRDTKGRAQFYFMVFISGDLNGKGCENWVDKFDKKCETSTDVIIENTYKTVYRKCSMLACEMRCNTVNYEVFDRILGCYYEFWSKDFLAGLTAFRTFAAYDFLKQSRVELESEHDPEKFEKLRLFWSKRITKFFQYILDYESSKDCEIKKKQSAQVIFALLQILFYQNPKNHLKLEFDRLLVERLKPYYNNYRLKFIIDIFK